MLKCPGMDCDLSGKTIVLGIAGGIAAYKTAELCRLLVKAGADVHVIMTEAAGHFITPLTLQTLSGHEVAHGLFDPGQESKIGHIRLASSADIIVIAPATADAIARFAAGMANDLLAAVVLASKAPTLLAPAMNTNMWENNITQENLARLCRGGRFTTVGPDAGDLACGWVGAGRMVSPDEIVAATHGRLGAVLIDAPGSLAGQRVVVTAGPTWEALDDVRFLGNRSSGKMGFALAAAAAELAADVTLIAGPVALATPPGVTSRIDVESALEMRGALRNVAATADIVVMSAAVADFRPGVRVLGKLSRRKEPRPGGRAVRLVANPDLLAELGRSRVAGRPYLVGFAAEVGLSSHALIERARAKLTEKSCDVVVANRVGRAGLGFGADENAVTLVFADGRALELPPARKDELARTIWAKLCREIALRAPASSAISPPDRPRRERPRGRNAQR